MARWTAAEDALLMEWYPEKGPKWERWADLLPGRGAEGIRRRANSLDIRTKHGESIHRGIVERKARLAAWRPWTEAEDRVILRALLDVSTEVGHTPADTADRLSHWVAKRRAEVARQMAERAQEAI